jgi:hypothetical protein
VILLPSSQSTKRLHHSIFKAFATCVKNTLSFYSRITEEDDDFDYPILGIFYLTLAAIATYL